MQKACVSTYEEEGKLLCFAKRKELRRTRHFQKSIGLLISAIYDNVDE